MADFLVVLILLQTSKREIRIPTWALALFAVSPVSLMVSGFHGNTDPVMVLFLVCAVWMCLRNQSGLAGLFFALSCQIKIVPLLLLPAFVLFWFSQNRSRGFLVSGAITTCLLWSEPLLHFPMLFANNVFAFYNITSGGLPWRVALAMDESKQHWTAWSLLPWLVITAGAIVLRRKIADGKLDLRLFKFVKLRAENA